MNYGIVGTGYWGSNHVRVATELADVGVVDDVVICDTDADRAQSLADEYDVGYTTDHTRLDVDAAAVATPSPTHERIATDLLSAGTHLLVEKPLALSAEAAWNVVETAEAHDRTLGVGHIFRYHPALTELKARIDDGELGEIKYLHTARFSFRVPRTTAGVLYSLAIHDVDVYEYLLGERPNQLFCTADSIVRDDIHETATLTLEYGDATGVIHASWQVPVFDKRRDLAVVGTERTAYVDYLENTELEVHETTIETDGDGRLRARDDGRTVHEVAEREPLKREVEAFVRAAREGRDPPASGRIGARAVEVLELAERSNARNEVVRMSAPTPRGQPRGSK